jgi:hypothetical protein
MCAKKSRTGARATPLTENVEMRVFTRRGSNWWRPRALVLILCASRLEADMVQG